MLSLRIFLCVLGPLPRLLLRCIYPFPSLKTSAFPTFGTGRRLATPMLWQLQHGAHFEATVIC